VTVRLAPGAARSLLVLAAVAVAACDRAPADLERAQELGTIEAYQEFLAEHPQARADLRAAAQSALDAALAARAAAEVEAKRRAAAWERARALDTIPAYRAFGREFAAAEESARADGEIVRLLGERHPAWRGVAALRLELDVQAPGARAVDLESRLRAVFERTLGYLGIELVATGGEGEIRVAARGRPLGASYSSTGVGDDATYLETGATMSGSFVVELAGHPPERRPFAARVKPPGAFVGEAPAVPYDQAAGLPVHTGFELFEYLRPAEETLAARWLLFLREVGGPSVARAALADPQSESWRSALLFAARWRNDGAADALLGAIQGQDNTQLVQALADLGGPAAAAALIDRLPGSFDTEIPNALARLRDARAIEPLIAKLEEVERAAIEGDERDEAIVRALRAITGENPGRRAAVWRTWLAGRGAAAAAPAASSLS
jgi:hypothetical protein